MFRATTPAELAGSFAVLPTELVGFGGGRLSPMAGRFATDGAAVCFVPRFAFVAGTSYSLRGPGPTEVWSILRPPRAGPATTQVAGIYPSAAEVPFNLLKIYVAFSAPMSEGESAGEVYFRRADTGQPLEGVFLPMDPELWDRRRQRLTLLLDPGRIKRGLAPHEEAGYPLQEGVAVVVEVGPGFRDAEGRPLAAGAARHYEVGPAVRATVDPAGWHCEAPAVGSTEPLIVHFDRPLDRALLEHSIAVGPVAGTPSIGPAERSWRFTPTGPWARGRHLVTVDPRLEDLAGNSVSRVFDRDLSLPEPPGASAGIEFECV